MRNNDTLQSIFIFVMKSMHNSFVAPFDQHFENNTHKIPETSKRTHYEHRKASNIQQKQRIQEKKKKKLEKRPANEQVTTGNHQLNTQSTHLAMILHVFYPRNNERRTQNAENSAEYSHTQFSKKKKIIITTTTVCIWVLYHPYRCVVITCKKENHNDIVFHFAFALFYLKYIHRGRVSENGVRGYT